MSGKRQSNCYNPGWDLAFAPEAKCESVKCKKTYDYTCMYNTQGQYVCQPNVQTDQDKDVEYGYTYILEQGHKTQPQSS